jgi:hypothetical protein
MKQPTLRLILCTTLLALLLPACAKQPQPARIEEIAFESGSFHVVGDLRLPEGTGPFPVVLFVHGSGPIDHTRPMGASQAGYVMPLALTQTRDVAFMICVSCPGMPSYDQGAFSVTA